MKKITLYPHGGSGNRGCEAIVRGTKKILDNYGLELFSSETQQDLDVHLNEICEVKKERKEINRLSLNYLKAFISFNLLNDKAAFDKITSLDFNFTSKELICISLTVICITIIYLLIGCLTKK